MTGAHSHSYRFNDRDEPLRWLRSEQILVRCPRCSEPAVVTNNRRPPARVTCTGCGFTREGHHLAPGAQFSGRVVGRCAACGRRFDLDRAIRSGTTTVAVRCDGCGTTSRQPIKYEKHTSLPAAPQVRGLDLWLQAECAGHILWAYDAAHLDFLERYVAATLREQAPGNSSLASRLPAWIKAARNRRKILAGLARLRRTLPPTPGMLYPCRRPCPQAPP